jgi:hypothetical protein
MTIFSFLNGNLPQIAPSSISTSLVSQMGYLTVKEAIYRAKLPETTGLAVL